MERDSLIYIISAYLTLVSGAASAATQRRIAFYKALVIGLFFTPLTGMIVLLRTSKKVTVTHYNIQDQCAGYHHWEQHEPEGCEFIGNLRKRLSVNRRYSI